MTNKNKVSVYLIKPSKYDSDGYVLRHWKGVLPSNTLACLYGLTEDVSKNSTFGKDLKWQIKLIDEAVQKVNTDGIIKESKKKNTKVIIGLVGVQSNQFPRAADLAMAFRKEEISVLIGGFHVSGSIAMSHEIPSEIKKIMDAGVTVIAGEAEGRWESILKDAVEDNLKPIYNYLLDPPNVSLAPLPSINKGYLGHFVSSNFATLDCGRGCPFSCSFCTVINVHGRAMRSRDVDHITNLLRENYYKHKVSFYFFTDDNFCRNKNWEAIFNALAKLREEEKIPVEFMMQVDTLSYKIPHFIEKAKKAGCKQAFIGMESINPQNLQSVGKRQNHVDEYKKLIQAYRNFNINTHAAYIIGFPFDTVQSIKEDIDCLNNEIGPEQASFFIMTPLPGSQYHVELKQLGETLEQDLNEYDSFHVTANHPNMTKEEVMEAYNNAWSSFYSLDNMEKILKRVSPENYWQTFMKFFWYKNSVMVEGGHPMLEGFFRFKDRLQRRPGYQTETPLQYFARRIKDIFRSVKSWFKLIAEMEELWLRTRPRSALEKRVIEELIKRHAYTKQWRDLKLYELKTIYSFALCSLIKATLDVNTLKKFNIPSLANLWLRQRNFFSLSLTYSRKSFEEFWQATWKQISEGHIFFLDITKLTSTVVQEVYLFSNFLYNLFNWVAKDLFRNTIYKRQKGKLLLPS